MKAFVICVTLVSLASFMTRAQTLEFEFIAGSERTVSIGQPPPAEYAAPMKEKRVSYKNKVLTITTVATGKVYDRVEVGRVIEFQKDKTTTYALEVKDKNGIFIYYLYQINKALSPESKSLITPFVSQGRFIMENTFFEVPWPNPFPRVCVVD